MTDITDNIKKLLCYNIVNNSKCVYKNKCMFAHNLEEQKKEPLREYIYNMIYLWDDLSNIDIYNDRLLFEDLVIYTKECKNCLNKKCPGGYNCKFGVCLKDLKICYNDLMYGKCYNLLKEQNDDGKIIKRCIHGVHLTEKFLIPYTQRIPIETFINDISFKTPNINYNYKNNTISLLLNDITIKYIKELVSIKNNKIELIKNINKINKNNNQILNSNNGDISSDDEIFDNEIKEYIKNRNIQETQYEEDTQDTQDIQKIEET